MGQTIADKEQLSPKEVVRRFLDEVRSGHFPEKADLYMAETVVAHQVNSEDPVSILRTPENYTSHVRDFIRMFGKFDFKVTELLAEDQKVYARWIQTGKHLEEIDGFKPTGLPLIEFTSAVYRVENGKIVEYWLQNDRRGMEMQLRKNQ
jgi:predicted ester cyclase